MGLDVEKGTRYGGRRKRKRAKIMLPVGQRVEVRNDDDGFQGSWYTATIDACCRQGWYVVYGIKYDHLLAEDDSELLDGHVRVPMPVEDSNSDSYRSADRGWIRPLPPPLRFGKWALYYGMCVEVHYQDGWWEGVIFDHEDGSEERRIFFPDLGDEKMAGIDALRISQEWDEVLGTWHQRGTWLFLELIEEFEREQCLPVSVKQLWYDLREKEGFKRLQEWTSSSRATWEELVSEAISDNLKIIFRLGTLPDGIEKLLGLAGPIRYENTKSKAVSTKNHFLEPFKGSLASKLWYVQSPNGQSAEDTTNEGELTRDLTNDKCDASLVGTGLCCHDEKACSEVGKLALPSNFTCSSVVNSPEEGVAGSMSIFINRKDSFSSKSKTGWLPAVPDFVPGPQFCPLAVIKYASLGNRRPEEDIIADTRKHLLYLKWKIDVMKDTVTRFRYTSPDGKFYFSLRLVCQDLCNLDSEISLITFDKQTSSPTFDNLPHALVKEFAENQDIHPSSQGVVSSHYHEMIVNPEYCPQAIVDWCGCGSYNKGKKGLRAPLVARARKHLSAIGWTFYYTTRRGFPEIKYTAPGGSRSFSSLIRACRYSLNVGSGRLTKRRYAIERRSGSEKPEIDHKKSPTALHVQKSRKVRRKEKDTLHTARNLFVSGTLDTSLQNMRCGRRKGQPLRSKHYDRQMQSYPALWLSKRQPQLTAPRHSHCQTRTVFSWLVDNNVLLPRQKVYYRRRDINHPLAEGRVTRHGIKCNCCGKRYSVNSFAVHAGEECLLPASGIFLEDGRSLLDCQMQVIREKTENFLAGPSDRLHKSFSNDDNDYICSVCHYGGELILCDQCPSSFHYTCLGMENIPDGEWFCPSCCCGICGQNKINEDPNHSVDNSSLCCTQCARKYHSGCLKDREIRLLGHPEENWFCSEKCEMVFLGLRDLLGKQISLDKDNLTWTLLKPRCIENHKLNACDMEHFTEAYSKLSIAVDIMHECFEPVVEPRTGRDLIGDVVFGKGSTLRRLNFQGFYTAILEKDDELITVATLRVHGEQVAEIPLIGTRCQYRKQGMCRVLMGVLEKELMGLGVQRVVLPAVPNVLSTWTGSFGFWKMAESEKLKLVNYTFLEFQGTVMCCKPLIDVSAESSQSSEVLPTLCNDASRTNHSIDLDRSSATNSGRSCAMNSEVLQSDDNESFGILQQGFIYDVAGNISGCNNDRSSIYVVKQPPDVKYEPSATGISSECNSEGCTLNKEQTNDYEATVENRCRLFCVGQLKYYRRRRFMGEKAYTQSLHWLHIVQDLSSVP